MLAYQRKGQGPTLVLVHGYLAGSAIWADQIEAFCGAYDVICPDLAGFGASAGLTEHLIEAQIDKTCVVAKVRRGLEVAAQFSPGHDAAHSRLRALCRAFKDRDPGVIGFDVHGVMQGHATVRDGNETGLGHGSFLFS